MISDIKPYPSAEIFNNKHRRRSVGLTGRPSFCPKFIEESGYLYFLFHAIFISLDHLLDHLAAHGTGLTAGEVAIVALLQVDAHFDWLTAVEVMDLPEFDHCTKAYHNWFQEILNSIL